MKNLLTVLLAASLVVNVTFITFGELIGYANNPAFIPYEDQFKLEASKRGVYGLRHAKIEFGKLSEAKRVGECYVSGGAHGRPHVMIDEKTWNNLRDSIREQLIFHELGHCLLLKDHSPGGIMNPSLLDAKDYETNRDKLIDQLFEGVKR